MNLFSALRPIAKQAAKGEYTEDFRHPNFVAHHDMPELLPGDEITKGLRGVFTPASGSRLFASPVTVLEGQAGIYVTRPNPEPAIAALRPLQMLSNHFGAQPVAVPRAELVETDTTWELPQRLGGGSIQKRPDLSTGTPSQMTPREQLQNLRSMFRN